MKIVFIIIILLLGYVVWHLSFGDVLKDMRERGRISSFVNDEAYHVQYILGRIDACEDKAQLVSIKEWVDEKAEAFAERVAAVCPDNPHGHDVGESMRKHIIDKYEKKLKAFEK